jgi:hypothetical protein
MQRRGPARLWVLSVLGAVRALAAVAARDAGAAVLALISLVNVRLFGRDGEECAGHGG